MQYILGFLAEKKKKPQNNKKPQQQLKKTTKKMPSFKSLKYSLFF